MALRSLIIAPCQTPQKGTAYCIEDTTPPSLIVGNIYAMSAFTSGGRFNTGCYQILGESDIDCAGPDPDVVVISSSFTPEQCEDCQTSIANVIQLSPCNISLQSIIISIDDITPTPSIGDVFNITVVYIDRNTGEQVFLTGCYSVSRFSFLPPIKFDILSPVVSYSAQTDCETCLDNNGILYDITECLTETIYVVSFPNNTFTNHLVTFTGLDGVTQYCGIVKGISEQITATGLLVSDLGIYDKVINNCDSCLETVADKKKLVNCLTGGEVIVWASTLFTVGDATNLSFDNGCYQISSDPVDPSTPVSITELADFDPHSNCEDCLECHGATYYYSSCTEVEVCGALNLISKGADYDSRKMQIDSLDNAFITSINTDGIIKLNISAATITDSVTGLGITPSGIAIDEINNVICVSDAFVNQLRFLDYTNLLNWTGITSTNSVSQKVYYDSGLFYVTFYSCGSFSGVEVYSASTWNTPTLLNSFGLGTDGYYDIVRIGTQLYAANACVSSIDIFNSTTYAYEGSISLGVNYPLSLSYDGSNSLYIALSSNDYGIIDIPTSGLTTYTYSPTCNSGVRTIKINTSTNRIYVVDYGCGTIHEINSLTNTLIKEFTTDLTGEFQISDIGIDSSGNTWFTSYYNLFQVGCNLEYITGAINSYEYVETGDTFYNPIKGVCAEVTSIDTSFGGENTFYSVLSYSGCSECTGQTFDLFYCLECSQGLYGGLLVAPTGQYTIGEFVKSHWGNSNWFCFEIMDNWDVNNYGVPDVIFDAEGQPSYTACTDCQGVATLGITVINCDTLVESQVTVTFEQWAQIEGVFGFSYPVISDTSGNCYIVVNSCPIDNTYPPFPLGDFYFNSTQCRANEITPLPPVSAGTEYFVCQICQGESGYTATQITVPHPVWTRPNGQQVTLLDAVQLGGMFGLNS